MLTPARDSKPLPRAWVKVPRDFHDRLGRGTGATAALSVYAVLAARERDGGCFTGRGRLGPLDTGLAKETVSRAKTVMTAAGLIVVHHSAGHVDAFRIPEPSIWAPVPVALAYRAGLGGEAFGRTAAELADEAGVGRARVFEALARLEADGLVERHRQDHAKGRQANSYTLILEPKSGLDHYPAEASTGDPKSGLNHYLDEPKSGLGPYPKSGLDHPEPDPGEPDPRVTGFLVSESSVSTGGREERDPGSVAATPPRDGTASGVARPSPQAARKEAGEKPAETPQDVALEETARRLVSCLGRRWDVGLSAERRQRRIMAAARRIVAAMDGYAASESDLLDAWGEVHMPEPAVTPEAIASEVEILTEARPPRHLRVVG